MRSSFDAKGDFLVIFSGSKAEETNGEGRA